MKKIVLSLLLIFLTILILSYLPGCKHNPEEIVTPENGGGGDTIVCDTLNVTYPGSVVPIFEKYCTGCHSGSTPQAGIDLTNYDDVTAIVQSGQLIGSINHIPPFSPMPKDQPKLAVCLIRTIEIWVNDTTFPSPGHPCDPDTIYFEKDLLPILQSNCAKPDCHDAITAQDGVRLTDYNSVMQTGDVQPFDPGNSEIYEVVIETDPDKRMPPPPGSPLTQEQINIILKWINQGAQNLFCDEEECDTLNVTYTSIIGPMINKFCVGCHNNNNPLGGITLEGYNNLVTVANNGSLLGVIRWESGFPQMPKNGNKLSDCQIRQTEIWIENGTPND
ncbi:MAG: hypothetical protein KKA81_03355 [Bacteroidetes bacterium]|nr:hypothetical protein [Bacteroidota bacterium]